MLRRVISPLVAMVVVGAIAGYLRVAEARAPQGAPDKSKPTFEQRQKVHKGLWSDYGAIGTIYDFLSQTTGDVVIRRAHIPGFSGEPANPPAYPPYRLIELACKSTAAIVGTAREATSGLMQGDAFIYSDVEFRVEEAIKNNDKAPMEPGSTIIVTRPGGTLTIQGRTVRAVDPDFRDFRPGRRYLLFLRFLPETGAYEATAEDGFELLDKKVRGLKQSPFWPDLEANDSDTLLSAARDASLSATRGAAEGALNCAQGGQ